MSLYQRYILIQIVEIRCRMDISTRRTSNMATKQIKLFLHKIRAHAICRNWVTHWNFNHVNMVQWNLSVTTTSEQDGFWVVTWCVGWCSEKNNSPNVCFYKCKLILSKLQSIELWSFFICCCPRVARQNDTQGYESDHPEISVLSAWIWACLPKIAIFKRITDP